MLAFVSRGFAKMYNELKPNLRSRDKLSPELKKSIRLSTKITTGLEKQIKDAKKSDAFVPLSTYTKASKKDAQHKLKPPVYVTAKDPDLEGRIRKSYVKEVVRPAIQSYSRQMKADVFILDRSEEAIKNRILTKETEEAERALIKQKEQERRKSIPSKDPQTILGLRTAENEVPKLTSTAIATTGEQLELRVGETTSVKGTVDLSGRSEGVLRFSDLSHKELANYICYNLQNEEETLQLFKYSRESSQYDSNLKAATLQKLALLSHKDISEDPRALDCIRDINNGIEDLTDKNLCDTIWAVGKLLGPKRERPQVVVWLVQKAIVEAQKRWENFNAMNIGYLVRGLDYLKVYPPALVEATLDKLGFFVEICEQIDDSKGISSVKYYPSELTGFSFFYGFTDYTIPRTPLPARAVDFIARFLIDSGKTEECRRTLQRAAQVTRKLNLYEVDTNRTISMLKTFTRDPQLGTSLEVRALVESLMHYLDVETVTSLDQITSVIQGLLNTNLVRLSGLLDNLVSKSSQLVGSSAENPEVVCQTSRAIARYLWMVNRGIDIKAEPHYWMLPCITLKHLTIDKLLDFTDSNTLNPNKVFPIIEDCCSLGYRLEGLNLEQSYECLLAQAVIRDDSLVHPKRYTNELTEILALIHLDQTHSIDAEQFASLILFNRQHFTNKDLIPAAWALVYLEQLEEAQQLVENLKTDNLSSLEMTLMWQIHLGLPKRFLSPDQYDKCKEAYHSWGLLKPHQGDEEVVLSKFTSHYDLPNYDPIRKASSVQIATEGFLKSGKLIGILRLQERQLKKSGISLNIHR